MRLIALLFSILCVKVSVAQQLPQMVLPIGHTEYINHIQFSPDGKLAVSSSLDNSARIWIVATGNLLATLPHSDFVWKAYFSADGKHVITACKDGQVQVWSTTGQLETRLEHRGELHDMLLSPSDSLVAVAYNSGLVVLWHWKVPIKYDTHFEKIVRCDTLAEDNRCYRLAFDKSGSILAGSGMDGQLVVFSTQQKKLLFISGSFTDDAFNMVAVSPDGRWAVMSDDTKLVLYAVPGGKLVKTVPQENIMTLIFTPDNKSLLSMGADLKCYRVPDGAELPAPKNCCIGTDAAFSPDSSMLAIGSSEVFTMYKTGTWEKLFEYDAYRANAVAFSADNSLVITSSESEAMVLHTGTGTLIAHLKNSVEKLHQLQLSPGGKFFITNSPHHLRVWDARNCQSISEIEHALHVWIGAVSPDERMIATCSFSDDAEIYQINGKLLARVDSMIGCSAAAFSSNNKFLAAGDNKGQVLLYDIAGNKILNKLYGKAAQETEDPPRTVFLQFIKAGTQLLAVYSNHSLTVWDPSTGTQAFALAFEGLIHAQFSKEGKFLVVHSDTALLTYRTSDYSLVSTIKPDIEYLHFTGFDISPDERFIVAVSAAGQMSKSKIYNVSTGNALGDFGLGYVVPRSIQFSPDGNQVLMTLTNNLVAWRIYDGQPLAVSANIRDSTSFEWSAYLPDGSGMITLGTNNSIQRWSVAEPEKMVKMKLLYSFLSLGKSESFLMLPEGHFFAPPAFSQKITYIANNRMQRFDAYDLLFNRPDRVMETVGHFNAAEYAAYHEAWGKRRAKYGPFRFPDDNAVKPTLRIVEKARIPSITNEPDLNLNYAISASEDIIDLLEITVNGVPISSSAFLFADRKMHHASGSLSVPLTIGLNRIVCRVRAQGGMTSDDEEVLISYLPKAGAPAPAVYFIGIGAGSYRDASKNLKYAAKDIHDLSVRLQQKFPGIHIDTLVNDQVSRENVNALRKRLEKTNANDLVLVSYSGHGLLDSRLDYFLATYDIDFAKPENGGLPYEELTGLLRGIPARRKLLFIDACHSGEVDKTALDSSSYTELIQKEAKGVEAPVVKISQNAFELMQQYFADIGPGDGTVVISASGGRAYAYEDARYANGVFTYALLSGLDGNADENGDAHITVGELRSYTGKTVVELTSGRQRPTTRQDNLGWNWMLW
jgi:WD40 repeat protein